MEIRSMLRVLPIALMGGMCISIGPFPGIAPDPVAAAARVKPAVNALTFVPNRGQVDPRVAYYAQGGGYGIFFTPERVVFTSASTATPSIASDAETKAGFSIALRFVDARQDVKPDALELAGTRVNYFIGRDPARWRTGLPTFREIVYRDVWPGIDVRFHGDAKRLKYEFVVHPGAPVDRIVLAYDGTTNVALDERGNLLVTTPLGPLVDESPVSFQDIDGRRVPVPSRFSLSRAPGKQPRYGFAVGDYSRDHPLVIDPGLVYSTYLGGAGDDKGRRVVVGPGGDVLVAGSTESPDFPATLDALDRTCGSDGICNPVSSSFVRPDLFIARFDATGTLMYATYLGGSRSDGANFDGGPGVAVDHEGNIYVAGATDSADFPTTDGAFRRTHGGGRDAFVAKLGPSGAALQYSTFLGGTASDSAHALAIDARGDVYLAGVTASSNFPVVRPLYAVKNGFGDDAFVAKVRPGEAGAASLVYSTYLGGSRRDVAYGIAVDDGGRMVVVGETRSANFPIARAFDGTFNSNQFFSDAFVAQLSEDGQTLLYSSYLGGSGADASLAVALDSASNVLVTGYTESPAFPSTADAYARRFNGSQDAFVAKVNPAAAGAGSLVYSTFLGGGGLDAGHAIAVEASGASWITGFTRSYGLFDAPVRDLDSFVDVFVAKLNDTGSRLLYGEYFGGRRSDVGYGIAVDPAGVAYVTGSTESIDFPVTATAFDANCGAAGNCDPDARFGFLHSDAFLLKIAPGGGEHGIASRDTPHGKSGVAAAAGARLQMPALFVENHGQMDPRIRFTLQQRDAAVYFTGERAVFAFAPPASDRAATQAAITPVSTAAAQPRAERLVPLALTFLDANRDVVMHGRRRAPGRINYLRGNDSAAWRRAVALYHEVVYPSLWRGIDLVFREERGRMKYELVVEPGADVGSARLTYDGAERLWIDQHGNLQIETALGLIADERPFSYQIIDGARVPVDSRFIVERSSGRATFGFAVGATYDPRYSLVIDPGLLWSTYLGGSGEDLARAVAVDAAGDVYVAGTTESPDFPVNAGAFDPLCGSDGTCNQDPRFGFRRQDVFVAKFTAAGDFIYATFLGGSSFDSVGHLFGGGGPSIAADRWGNVYLTGSTSSSDFPTTDNAYDRALSGGTDAYLVKLDATGSRLLYSTYFGGRNDAPSFGGEFANAIAIDAQGHAYITGRTNSRDLPTTAGAFDRTYNSAITGRFVDFERGGDAFVARFNPRASGGASLIYSTYVGGGDTEQGLSIAVNAAGHAYVGGWTRSVNLPLPGAFDSTYNGGFLGDGWLFKIDASGAAIMYGTYLGGSLTDLVSGVAVDNRGHAYVAGSTESANYPTTADAYDRVFSGAWPIGDGFVSKVDTNVAGVDSLVYSTYLGGSSIDGVEAVAVDAGGAAYIAGFTRSFGMFDNSGLGNTYNGFVAKLNPPGSKLIFGTYVGGLQFDHASSVAVDTGGAAYVAGYTRSTDFPTTDNAFDRTCGTDAACDPHPVFGSTRADAFVVKVAPGNPQ